MGAACPGIGVGRRLAMTTTQVCRGTDRCHREINLRINPPTNFQATAISDTRIDLTWVDNSDNELEFEIQRKTGAGAYASVAFPDANIEAHSDLGLTAETTYTYRIRASNNKNDSSWSNETTATTNISAGNGGPPTGTGYFYVDIAIGSDSYDGTSETVDGGGVGPWASMQKAVATLVGGQTAWVKNGNYYADGGSWTTPALNPTNNGTAENWIRFMAYPGHQPYIYNNSIYSDPSDPLIGGKDRQYILWDGFEVYNASPKVAVINSCNNVVIQNCEIHGARAGRGQNAEDIRIEGCTFCTVRNCLLYDVDDGDSPIAYGDGIKMYSSTYITMEYNEAYDTGDGLRNKNGGSNSIWRYNWIHDCRGAGIPTGHTTKDHIVHNNVIVRCAKGVDLGGTNNPHSGDAIYNNTIMDMSRHAIACADAQVDDVKVWNNIIVNCDSSELIGNGNLSYNDYNLFYECPQGDGANSFTADPQFVGPTETNPEHFRVGASSPARLAGRYGEDIGAFQQYSPLEVVGPTAGVPQLVTGITFDEASWHFRNNGADLWPWCWHKDDFLYVAGGDGQGWDGVGGTGMNVNKLFGPPDGDFSNYGGAGDTSYGVGLFEKGTVLPKGMISVDGVLYLLEQERGTGFDSSRIGKSTDNGVTWTYNGDGVTTWDFTTPAFAQGTFINFGKGNAQARDLYVYLTGEERDDGTVGSPHDQIVLARVPKAEIQTRASYEFFSGTQAAPAWSTNVANRTPIFTRTNGMTWGTVISYHPVFRSYLMTFFVEGTGDLAVYNAPEPWGPWTNIFEGPWIDSAEKHSVRFVNKNNGVEVPWLSTDGLTWWFTWSGSTYDDFNVGKATLSVS